MFHTSSFHTLFMLSFPRSKKFSLSCFVPREVLDLIDVTLLLTFNLSSSDCTVLRHLQCFSKKGSGATAKTVRVNKQIC